MDYERKKYLAIKWLQCVEDCEKSGYDGSTEYAKEFLDLAEPELLSLHGLKPRRILNNTQYGNGNWRNFHTSHR